MSFSIKDQVQDMYALSPMQQGMLFHALLDDQKNSHLVQMTITLEGDLDVGIFVNSIQKLVDRYDVFRTTFIHEKMKQPLQVVLKSRPIPIQHIDLTSYDEAEKTRLLEQYRLEDQMTHFDLASDPLMRVKVVTTGESRFVVIWSFHHILMDGWCFHLIFHDLLSFYLVEKHQASIHMEMPLPYSSFIKWLGRQDQESAQQYWRHYLNGYEAVSSVPRLSGTPKKAETRHTQASFSITRDVTEKLQQLAAQCDVTFSTVFQAIWGMVLQKYNDVDDIIFGTVVSGRPTELYGVDHMVGLFINTLPLRIQSQKDESFAEVVKKVHLNILQSRKYEHFPLYEIQNLSEQKQGLFDHIMVIENYPLVEALQKNPFMQQAGFMISDVKMYEPTNYDLTIMVQPREEIAVRIDYEANLFDEGIINRMIGHIKSIASQVASNPHILIKELTVLTQEESKRFVEQFHKNSVAYPAKTIHELFHEQAERTPDRIAVVFEDKKVTYRQLEDASNQLARFLQKKQVHADQVVGILMNRSIEMVVAILGVLKAGGAFLPIDPEYPEERIAYMLEDSSSHVVLTQADVMQSRLLRAEAIDIEDSRIWQESNEPVECMNQPEDLFYVIYTSGTTGKPKGVMLEHRNFANLMQDSFENSGIPFTEKVLQYTTCSFDVCYQEIFSTLLAGGQLYLIRNEMKQDIEQLFHLIEREQISVLFLPAAFLKFIFHEQDYAHLFPRCVKHIITAGEQLVVTAEFNRHLRHHKVTLHNHYGPSETHVVTTYTISPNQAYQELPPIGKSISNTGIYIMDSAQKLLPEGLVGELYITGANVGRGYLGKPDLTAEKFLEDPLVPGQRMYRTGDLARWLPDGNLEYLGRIDHQVKIRGHRIELGEIDSHLLNHPLVKEAVAIDRLDDQGDQVICAYVVPTGEKWETELREALSRSLPEYMMPAYFVEMDRIPLTPNGKVDRRALPKPDKTVSRETDYVAPTDELESKIAEVWRQILDMQQVGIYDNFFSLGGHSLKAILLISRLQKECKLNVPIQWLFKHPTIHGIARYVREHGQGEYVPIQPVSNQEWYPVSFAQKRMLILEQAKQAGTTYHIPSALILTGELDVKRLEWALQVLFDRHESLRTSFHTQGGELVQRIHPYVKVTIEQGECPEALPDAFLNSFIRPFDLSMAPLMRVGLARMADNRHLLVFDQHHAISDGVSVSILLDELARLYAGDRLPDLPIQYKDFAVWQQQFAESVAYRKQQAYWQQVFGDDVPVMSMPTDYPRPSVQSFEGDRVAFSTAKALSEQLQQLASQTGTTLYMVLLAAFQVLLSKYSRQEDIIVGTPIAGRSHADTQAIVGMFVNTLAMRNKPAGHKPFHHFLQEVRQQTLEAFTHADYPLERLVEDLGLQWDASRNPLFDTLFVLQNTEAIPAALGPLQMESYVPQAKQAKFEITLEAIQTDSGIQFHLDYATKLFTRETMERLGRHFVQLLQMVVQNPENRIAEISMLTAEERHQVLVAFNHTKQSYPHEMTIQQLFEQQVEKSPDKDAVVCQHERITFAELNHRANAVAYRLREKGVTSERIVALFLDRSIDFVVGMLGILKAGGAFLPIDPDYPEERIRYLIEDSEARWIVTKDPYLPRVPLDMDVLDLASMETGDAHIENPAVCNGPNDLAYLIYTSGTTGNPKGVMLEHRGVANLQSVFENTIGVTPQDRVIHFASVSFDASVWEMFMGLLTGATLHVTAKEEISDFRRFEDYVNDHQLTILTLPPTYVVHLDPKRIPSVHTLITAGSASSEALVNQWKDHVRYVNGYGPTENTVATTLWFATCTAEIIKNVPIGSPIPNCHVCILDQNLQLQGIGQVGELCVSGVGLARGYWKRPELTAEKFVAHPYLPGERLYRTGDLARWLPNGQLEYLGRIDHQVKIRGHRIELGEIESVLLRHPDIKEAAVIAREDQAGQPYLCAYVVGQSALPPVALRAYLREALPQYMIPSYFMQLEKMPLTANDKIDGKALPKPDFSQSTGREFVAPRSTLEQTLTVIFQEVLGIDRVGIHDHFFELGGHSLKAMALITRVHRDLHAELPLQVVFEQPTVAELAIYLSGSRSETGYSPIVPVEEKDYYPASSAQKRMYLLQQWENTGVSYNMPGILLLEGELDPQRWIECIHKLVQRHESLRTSFMYEGKELFQCIHDHVMIEVPYTESDEGDIEKHFHAFVQSFDLSKAPLLRSSLIKISKGKHLFLYDFHHIIADGASIATMLKEVVSSYHGNEVEAPTVQYKDYSIWQQEWLQSDAYKAQEAHWISVMSGELPVLDLQTDYPRPAVQNFEGDHYRIGLGTELQQQLHQLAAQTGTTVSILLLAACNVLLSKYAGQEDILVGVPISGRTHPDVRDTVGMFVNTVCVRSRAESSLTFLAFLESVKEQSLQAYANQDYPFEQLIERLGITRDPSRNPLFDVMYIYQHADQPFPANHTLTVKHYPSEIAMKVAKFDLVFHLSEEPLETVLRMEYATSLFTADTIARMAQHFIRILKAVVQQPDRPLADVDILSEEEKHRQLVGLNDTTSRFELLTIPQLFERQVKATPDQVAVVSNEKRLTYGELNDRANRLAVTLQEMGVGANRFVIMYAERSLEWIVGTLAVLKAGGAFVPVDPDYPIERVRYMLEDSAASWVLTQTHLLEKVPGNAVVIDLEDERNYTDSAVIPEAACIPDDLAYMIYTSGTTGNPKGVMIPHKGIANLHHFFTETLGVSGEERIGQFASPSFDASVWEITMALTTGASLYLLTKDIINDFTRFSTYVKEHRLSALTLPPAYVVHLEPEQFPSLKTLITAGSATSRALVDKWRENVAYINAYGPTETTICATFWTANDTVGIHPSVPIGKPLPNTQVLIVDKQLRLVPAGQVGELCVSGVGLAIGYWNRPDLTAEKFVEHPYLPGEKMYRTGDLARWLPDGNVEYLGRSDHQVKIRGHRVEPEEVEAVLLRHPQVKEAVVIARQDQESQSYLCAYFVLTDGDSKSLRAHVSQSLPGYMVPSHFIQLDNMPLTPNGKIDRNALPAPATEPRSLDAEESPRDDRQEMVAAVWKEVLGIQNIGIYDNFFELGGDSIKAIQVSTRLNQLGWKLEVKDLFQFPTIEQLTPQLTAKNAKKEQGPVEGEVPYTAIQKWFFSRHITSRHHWNQAMMLCSQERLDEIAMERALQIIIEHHDALRMTYLPTEDGMVQWNRSNKVTSNLFDFACYDLTKEPQADEKVTAIANTLQGSIELTDGPLVKAAIFKTAEADHILLIIHHLVVDGVSWRIILEDLTAVYEGLVADKETVLPEKTDSFQTWAKAMQDYAASQEVLKEINYWQSLEQTSGVLPLPKDFQVDQPQRQQHTKLAKVSLSREQTENLLRRVHHAYHTNINDLLLTALGLSLTEWTRAEQVAVNLEGHGRMNNLESLDVSRTVGWFTSQYPIVLQLDPAHDLSHQIKQVKEMLRHIPNKGIGYDILRHLTPKELCPSLQFSLQPEISFNYLGQFDARAASGSFHFSPLSTGDLFAPDSERLFVLDISAVIEEGELLILYGYSEREYKEETIVRLAERFRDELLRIIEHCMSKEHAEMTPSDVGDEDLTMEEWENILELI